MSTIEHNLSSQGGPKLSEIFDNIWKIWEFIECTSEASGSDKIQSKIREGCAAAEKAILMVNQLQLFSDNEELEEVASNEIRYILLPGLLGYLLSKITTKDRLEVIKRAQVFHIDYLHLCKNYGVTEIEVPTIIEDDEAEEDKSHTHTATNRPGPPDLVAMNAKRFRKIERYKQQKVTDKQLMELKPQVDREHVDDEVKRQYYTTLLKKWVNICMEELEAIEDEIGILKLMSGMKLGQNHAAKPEQKPKSQPFRPFILTKSDLQKEVFGAGYPSLPTYTVEEFFDQQVALGNIPQPGRGSGISQGAMNSPESEREEREREDAEKERKRDEDDPETLQKARQWDDWKDDHRTGWGNTQNKG